MLNTPPPLQWLSAFEAAARLQSFKKAGDALSVTPSAISQQIKLLEDHLGLLLFNRLTRKVELTDSGHAYFQLAEKTLSIFKAGHQSFCERFSKPTLRISMMPFVALDIVLPALHQFQAQQPNVELRIETSMSVIDFESDTIDAAIRFGDGQWPGLTILPLTPCSATIVASPALLAQQPINQVQDLFPHTLIHCRNTHNDWSDVARFVGLDEIKTQGNLVLDCYLAALSAAENGLGVAIGILPLCQSWIKKGRLAMLAPPVPIQQQYYFVMRNDQHKRAELLKVYQWIKNLFDSL